MHINELYQKLQEEDFIEQLNGELTLEGNCIVWNYDINDNEDSETTDVEDDEEFPYFITSSAEILQEKYDADITIIENLINMVDEFSDWTFSQPEVGETTISFKIF